MSNLWYLFIIPSSPYILAFNLNFKPNIVTESYIAIYFHRLILYKSGFNLTYLRLPGKQKMYICSTYLSFKFQW